jgi:hypothetical protein
MLSFCNGGTATYIRMITRLQVLSERGRLFGLSQPWERSRARFDVNTVYLRSVYPFLANVGTLIPESFNVACELCSNADLSGLLCCDCVTGCVRRSLGNHCGDET